MSSFAVTLSGTWEQPTSSSRVIELYEAHRDGIYRFLVGQGMSPGEAQEATQDAFVDLHQAVVKGAFIRSPQAWLYKVASRAVVDYWRRNHKKTEVPLDGDTELCLSAKERSPEEAAEGRQRLRRIAEGLAKLPGEQLLCVQLRMKGLRYREIAEAVGAPVSTVADRLTAAVMFLRQQCQ